MKPTISVIGLGKLGSPIVAAVAERGFTAIGADLKQETVDTINRGNAPVSEPGLDEMLKRNRERISATTDIESAVSKTDISFVIVPTPTDASGGFTNSYVLEACKPIGLAIKRKPTFHVVVVTSTVMPGSSLKEIIPELERISGKTCGVDFGFCYNPEFIALGSVIRNLLNPDFVLIGESDPKSGELLAEFYKGFCLNAPPIKRIGVVNAEISKIAINTYVTSKISYANMLAELCDRIPGGNVDEVSAALGHDTRIGRKYLNGGVGYGGPCFPRDNRALSHLYSRFGLHHAIADATDEINNAHSRFLVEKIKGLLPNKGRVAILGLTYKPDTPVVEASQNLEVAQQLLQEGYAVWAYDPGAVSNTTDGRLTGIVRTASMRECIDGADLICLMTLWDEFESLDASAFIGPKKPYVLDCWRAMDPKKLGDRIHYVPLGINIRKTALVCGAGGFIGSHLVKRLKSEGFWVRGVDLKRPDFSPTKADEFVVGDLRDANLCMSILDRPFDEVYQLAADMGGAGYIFTGEHDADVMHNSATVNLNMAYYGQKAGIKKIFYSSSACIYPEYNQLDPLNPKCSEESAYPAAPDSEYGWEKLFSERMYMSFRRNYGLDTKIARFHNIFGPEGTWRGGKEKAPAAMCRKVAETPDAGTIEVWGDGEQTRSFLYIDECLDGIRRLMDSPDFHGPVNIGSEEMVTINQLAQMTMSIAGKKLEIKHIDGPLGVRGRKSDNTLISEKLGWKPTQPLKEGLEKTYAWVNYQANNPHGHP